MMPQVGALLGIATATQAAGVVASVEGGKWEPIAIQAAGVLISALAAFVASRKRPARRSRSNPTKKAQRP